MGLTTEMDRVDQKTQIVWVDSTIQTCPTGLIVPVNFINLARPSLTLLGCRACPTCLGHCTHLIRLCCQANLVRMGLRAYPACVGCWGHLSCLGHQAHPIICVVELVQSVKVFGSTRLVWLVKPVYILGQIDNSTKELKMWD